MKRRVLLNVLAVVLVVAFAALGRWQLGRGELKSRQLEQAAAALAAPPTAIAAALAEAGSAPRRVEGRVRFAPSPVLWLDNQRRGDRVGVRQYCVARTGGGAAPAAVLVDMGWLPLAGDRSLPAQACPDGEHPVAGLLLPPPAVGLRLGPGLVESAPSTWLATRVEPGAIAAAWRIPSLAGRVIRLDPAAPLGFERDLELHANTLPPEKHRGYALQWFGLAATTLIIALVLNLRSRP